MEKNHQIWRAWADRLHGWGVTNFAVSLLRLSKPFHYIGAQTIYLTQPYLSLIMDEHDLSEFANLLEDESDLSKFMSYLEDDLV